MGGSDDLPPVPLKKWHTREDSGLYVDRRGRWWHDDELIDHPNIIEAFNRGLRVLPDGKYQLHFGNDWCFVEVEEYAFQIVAVDVSADDRLSLRLSDRTAEWLDASSLWVDDEGVLACRVKEGLARARCSRDAQFQLVQHLAADQGGVVLVVGARRWPTSLPLSVLE